MNPVDVIQIDRKMESIWASLILLADRSKCVICKISGNCSKQSKRRNRRPLKKGDIIIWVFPKLHNITKATVGWSLEWQIYGEPFLSSRSVGKLKIKKN